MKIKTIFFILVNFSALMIDLANLKPIPYLAGDPKGCVHSEQIFRARRSLPDIGGSTADAVNLPIQTGVESLEPAKLQGSVDTPAKLVKDNGLVQGDGMPADEQAECYKQQNIEPPNNSPIEPVDRPRPILRLQDQRPFADAFPNSQSMLSRPAIYKEKATKKLRGREEDNVITSLYSDPEIRHGKQNQKSMIKQPRDDRMPARVPAMDLDHHQSVYKPVGVRPEFPVYDEDIDFHPDPLQGILEDKYWLDPQEQEAVIRKYIDLANNGQPARHDFTKRDVPREHMPKSVDSKEAFREAAAVERECPCMEMAACKDCNKGKWGGKKTNLSEINLDASEKDKYERRKLLSMDYGNDEGRDGDIIFDGENQYLKADSSEHHAQEINNDLETESNILGNGVLSNEESEREEDVPSFTSNYFGRKLLSVENSENSDDDYAEDGDSEATEDVTPKGVLNLVQSTDQILDYMSKGSNKDENVASTMYDRHSGGSDGNVVNNEENTLREKYYNNPVILNTSNTGVFEYKFETEKIDDEKREKLSPAEEFKYFQKPFLDESHNTAKYYVPNKLDNLLQKVIFMKKKPNEKAATIDPDLEFALEQNQTFVNVSRAMSDINISLTTEWSEPGNKIKRLVQPVFSGRNGRRIYQLPLLKHPNVKALQGPEDSGSNENSTVNEISATTSSLTIETSLNTTAENTTGLNVNSTLNSNSTLNATETPTPANTTENATTASTLTGKTTKKKEDYDEDSFDAEIANDIVETVIAESQSGSVVGHNLGLCRRNDTLSKYAKVSPESEQLMKRVTECILDRIRDRLEGQSCTLLDDELLQFLKWMVLSGESYKDYMARIRPELREFKSEVHEEAAGPPLHGAPTPSAAPHHSAATVTPVASVTPVTPKHA